MKKSWKWVLCLALAVTMLCCTALAADAPEIAQASGCTITEANGEFTVTVPATASDQYVLFMVKPLAGLNTDSAAALLAAAQSSTTTPYALDTDTIFYINQFQANGATISFENFQPKVVTTCLFVVGGGAEGQSEPRIVGAMVTQGVTVTGTATAKGATTGDVTVTIKDGTATVGTATVTSGGTYTISGVPAQAGLTVEVSSTIKGKQDKVKYVTRTDELDATTTTAKNVELWPNGDANGDGRITTGDATAIFNHLRFGSTNKLTGYALKCADANGDNRNTTGDATAIFNHLRFGSTNVLW